jgi:mannose/fructose/N-acetylgalactosamine-specific phosphotransferase system component IIB
MMGGFQVKIAMVRVDDRLVHGQVVVGWTRTLGVNHLVVADDAAAGNSMQRSLLKLAVPAGVRLSVLGVEEAARQLQAGSFGEDTILLLLRGPQTLLQLLQAGFSLEKVNVGNVRMAEGKVRLTREVHANAEELAAWKSIDSLGVKLEAQWVPDQPRTLLNPIIKAQP